MKQVCIITITKNNDIEYSFIMAPLNSPNIIYKAA